MKNKYLIIIFIAALIIRLIALNQSLWLDEATTAQTVKHFQYLEIITRFSPTDFHPPLYYLFMKAWTSIFGYSEVALRMPSVIFSLLAGWFMYLIGKQLKDEQTGLWAAAFFLCNPLIFYYSQEARMYLMAVCFLTTAMYMFMRKRIVLTNVFFALSFFTFYGSVFLILSIYSYLLYKRRLRSLIFLLIGPVLSLIILSPLLYRQYIHAQELLSLVPHWSLVLGKANVKNILLIPLKFSVGRIQFEPKTIYYTAAGAWTLLIFFYVVRGALKNKLLGFLFFVPLIAGFIFSFFTPLLQYFRFIYLIPLYALLIVHGLSGRRQKVLYLAVFLCMSLIYILKPEFHRENWKVLAQTIRSGDAVYMVYTSSDPLQYYLDTYHISATIKDLGGLTKKDLTVKKVTVIPYTADIHGISYKDALQKRKYQNKVTFTVRGLTSEVWEK